jgi:hypothetical protein
MGRTKPIGFIAELALTGSLLICATIVGLASAQEGRLPFQDSPFGSHPASVPPDVGQGDPWACAREIGVRWHRPVVYAFWFMCQDDSATTFRWDRLDASVRGVPKGTNVLWNLSARSRTHPSSFLPRDMQGYRDYVQAVVERYDGNAPGSPVVRYWQVENEPNLGPQQGTPEQYAELLRETYRAAKQANPRCKIVIGGVGGWVGHGPGSSLQQFRTFYIPVLKELDGTGFDIFDYHWYGNALGDYRAYGEVHHEVRAALNKYGFKQVPIWITEMGSFSGRPRGHRPQSEAQQAGDLLRRYVYPLSLGVQKVFWAFGLVEGFKHDDGYFDHTGLIYDGHETGDRGRGVRKLAYYTYKLMTEELEGKRFVENVPHLPAHVYGYRFGKEADWVIIVWWDWWNEPEKTEKAVMFPVEADVSITSALTDRNGVRRSWDADGRGNHLTLKLGKEPLFIRPGQPP